LMRRIYALLETCSFEEIGVARSAFVEAGS